MTHVLLAVLTAGVLTATMLYAWNRERLFWVTVAAVDLVAGVILFAAGRVVNRPDIWVVIAFAYLGPLAVTSSTLRVRLVTLTRLRAVVAGLLAYAIGFVLWLTVAVNLHALVP
jgi:hypothetical protein